nr:putative ribonuclease H-like domain-containing protein [Tanacetum cinerariifolium]
MSAPMTSQSAFSFPKPNSSSTQQETFTSFSPGQTNAKFPYLKKEEYETWAMKMEYWIMNTDHNLWKIILNGNSKKILGRDSKGGIIILPPVSFEEHVAVQRETKARTLLVQSLPEDYMADFYYLADARYIWLAVKARFGGNEESKKMQKTMLKQEFSEFSVSEEEGLHKGYDRFQKILSQLNQMQAKPDNDDVNLKFLRALPPFWSQVVLTLKTKGGLEYLSFDDLYNKLRSLKIDVKDGSSYGSRSTIVAPTHSAFIGAASTNTKMVYPDQPSHSSLITYTSTHSGSIMEDVLHSFVAKNKLLQQLVYEDFEQEGRLTSTTRTLPENKTEEAEQVYGLMAGFKSDFADHDGNAAGSVYDAAAKFAMMGISPKAHNHVLLNAKIKKKEWEVKLVESLARFDKWMESSKNLAKLINSSMSTRTKLGLGFKDCIGLDEVFDLSTPNVFDPEPATREVKSLYERFVKAGEMHEVSPTITGTFMPTPYKSDLEETQVTFGLKSTTSSINTSESNDFVSCDNSDKSSQSEPHDFASCVLTPTTTDSFSTIEVKILPKSDVKDPSPTNGFLVVLLRRIKSHLIKDCDVYDNVDTFPSVVSQAASIPAGSRNSSRSIFADRTIPAASRNRPASIYAGRYVPAGSRNSLASISANRSIPTARRNKLASIHDCRHIPAGRFHKPAPFPTGRSVPTGWTNHAARPFFRPTNLYFDNVFWPGFYDHMSMNEGRWGSAVKSSASGTITFGGGDGMITGKGTIRTSKLNFENVYYVEELQNFNLFSVSQICDKKNKVLFTNADKISEMASKQFSLEPGLSNLNEMRKSSNPSVSQVSETSKKDLEDLFHNFYDEYFNSSKIMKSSTTNVQTLINEEVFHEVSEPVHEESSSSSLNDDVQQSSKEVILPQTNTQSISNSMLPNVDEASTSHNVFNERLEDAYFDSSTSFHDPNKPASIHTGRHIPAGRPTNLCFDNVSWPGIYDHMIMNEGRWGSAVMSLAGKKEKFDDFVQVKGGTVTFGGGDGKITGKGTIRTSKLNFENNKVLFTNDECLVLTKKFPLPDESQVVLRIPRRHDLYTFNLSDIQPEQHINYLLAKASLAKSTKWHRRMVHVNFKTINKLAKNGMVAGLPLKLFTNEYNYVACNKGKQHKALYKAIYAVRTISEPLQLLHIDLFGPTSIRSIDHKYYSLVVTDDFNRFSRAFFLGTKDETFYILKDFLALIENQLNKKVKAIRCDNGTEFQNAKLIDLCRAKGIKMDYSNARTLQQNGVAERKNRTLIEAARSMLADSKLHTMFWTEAVSTACYVLNRVSITYPHNKTPYELLSGKVPNISHFKPFRCHVTILITSDHLCKFEGKASEGFLVGYVAHSKAYRVYNLSSKKVEETLNLRYLKDKPNVQGLGQEWYFDLDYLIDSLGYTHFKTNTPAGTQDTTIIAGTQDNGSDSKCDEQAILVLSFPSKSFSGPKVTEVSATIKNHLDYAEKLTQLQRQENEAHSTAERDLVLAARDSAGSLVSTSGILASSITAGSIPTSSIPAGRIPTGSISAGSVPASSVPASSIFAGGVLAGSAGIFTSSSYDDDFCTDVTNLASQPYSMATALKDTDWVAAMQEEMQQFFNQQVWKLVPLPARKIAIGTKWILKNERDARAIILFLAFASYMGFMVYQMDVKSAFLYGEIDEEVYVTQPKGFEDPHHPKHVYRVVKALYDLHQAPRAWHIILVQVYVDDIIFGSTNKAWCDEFEVLMKGEFEMSAMGEMTFFLGLQVKQLPDGIFLSQDKYVKDMLKKFDMESVMTATTPYEVPNLKSKDESNDAINVHLYRSMIGSLMYLTASRLDSMFAASNAAGNIGDPVGVLVYAVGWVSAVKQFWATATVHTLEAWPSDIIATINGNEVRVSESLIQTQLKLNDVNGLSEFTLHDVLDGMREIGPSTAAQETTMWEPMPVKEPTPSPVREPTPFWVPSPDSPRPHSPPPYSRSEEVGPTTSIRPPSPTRQTSFQEDFSEGGGDFVSSPKSNEASQTPAATAAGGAEDSAALTTLYIKLDMCIDRVTSLENELGITKKVLGGKEAASKEQDIDLDALHKLDSTSLGGVEN